VKTLRIHEIESHGYSFEADDGDPDFRFLGTFDRVEIYRFSDYEKSVDENGEHPDGDLLPSLVIEAGDQHRQQQPELTPEYLQQEIDEIHGILAKLLDTFDVYLKTFHEPVTIGQEVPDTFYPEQPPITNPHTGEETAAGPTTGWVVFPEHGAAFRLVDSRLRMAPLLSTVSVEVQQSGSLHHERAAGDRELHAFDMRDEVEVDFDRLDEADRERLGKVELAMYQRYLRDQETEARVDEARGEI